MANIQADKSAYISCANRFSSMTTPSFVNGCVRSPFSQGWGSRLTAREVNCVHD